MLFVNHISSQPKRKYKRRDFKSYYIKTVNVEKVSCQPYEPRNDVSTRSIFITTHPHPNPHSTTVTDSDSNTNSQSISNANSKNSNTDTTSQKRYSEEGIQNTFKNIRATLSLEIASYYSQALDPPKQKHWCGRSGTIPYICNVWNLDHKQSQCRMIE